MDKENKYRKLMRNSIIENTQSSTKIFLNQVYGWMSCGLFITAFAAFYLFQSGLAMVIASKPLLSIGLFIAQLGLVILLGSRMSYTRLSAGVVTSIFMGYSALTGISLSMLFLYYTQESMVSTFFVAGGMFAITSLYGYLTKTDLSKLGNLLFMAMIGIILSSLVNLWLRSSTLMWITTYISVLVFTGLTAYDTQRLKELGANLDVSDETTLRQYAIRGALSLYLDFINLFINLLRITGTRRS